MTEEILTTKFNINNSYRSNFDIKSLLTLRFNDFFYSTLKNTLYKVSSASLSNQVIWKNLPDGFVFKHDNKNNCLQWKKRSTFKLKCCMNIFHLLTVKDRLSFLQIKNTQIGDICFIMQHHPQDSAKCKLSRH